MGDIAIPASNLILGLDLRPALATVILANMMQMEDRKMHAKLSLLSRSLLHPFQLHGNLTGISY